MTKHKIAIVVGSLREGSLNRRVAKSICAFASDVLDCTIVEIGEAWSWLLTPAGVSAG
jgi:chromate reductase